MCWTNLASGLHGSCTNSGGSRKSAVLHIRSCGYAWVCPQTGRASKRTALPTSLGAGRSGGFLSWSARSGQVEPGSAAFHQQTRLPTKKKIFQRSASSTSGLQPKSVYKDSSSVNNCHFLWISLLTDKKSVVYARYKPVVWRCMFLVANLDKNRHRGKSRVFAQTVPVDIKKLIHTSPSGASFTIW